MITCKFGGTSLADAANIRRVADIIHSDPERRFVIVSAPGKRFPQDVKITDMLIRFQVTGDPKDFDPIQDRFQEIITDLGLDLDLSQDYAEIKNEPHNADYLASCGEYLSARIMAAYLGWPFVDTEFCIFFDEQGMLDTRKTRHALHEKLDNLEHAVLPGYYGAMPDGQVHTFSRGGSDISGALVARAMHADVYENWTDVDGMLTADPRLVPEATTIPQITYAELEEMAYQGATVLHEDAVRPVWDAGIPIHIRNTFNPDTAGTWIRKEVPVSDRQVTGITGRKGFATMTVVKEKMHSMVGYVRKVLSCLQKRGIAWAHVATGLGRFSLVLPSDALQFFREELETQINATVHPDELRFSDGLSVIAVVGSGMLNHPGVAGNVFMALGNNSINVRMIDMGASEMNIIVGVDEADYARGIQAIYQQFFM